MGVARIFFGGGTLSKNFSKNSTKIVKKISKNIQKFFKHIQKISKKFWKIFKNFLKKFPKMHYFHARPRDFFRGGGSEIHQGRACKGGRRMGGSGGLSPPDAGDVFKKSVKKQ